MPEASADGSAAPPVIAELKQLVGQTTRLARLELELAKTELAGKAGSVATAAGLLVGAALFGFLAICLLSAAAVLALATAVAGWLAAVIVFAVYLLAAGTLALLGRGRIKHATPLMPERAIDSLKGDLKWAETQLKSTGT
jgi:uncharacterized membrane protein YqjE